MPGWSLVPILLRVGFRLQKSGRMLDSIEPAGPLFEPATEIRAADKGGVPDYLRQHYWWAYIHPKAVRIFDRPWLINLILLGNYKRLRDAALAEFSGAAIGNVLQIACAYGDLTSQLTRRIAAKGGRIDIVDVLPIQLRNTKWKLPGRSPARLLCMDSTDLKLPEARYDWVLLFFLLHEQPARHRLRTLNEAFRVVKPGGKVLIVDYARPKWWNPLRYLWPPLLALLEPFALDLWRQDIAAWLPPGAESVSCKREGFFGGFYQKVVITRPEAKSISSGQ